MLLGTTTNCRYSEKQLLQNSKDNMLRNSVSVDMNTYVLQLKQTSTAGVFHRIPRNFRTVTSENNFRGYFCEEHRGGEEDTQWPFWFQVSRAAICYVMKQSSFCANFRKFFLPFEPIFSPCVLRAHVFYVLLCLSAFVFHVPMCLCNSFLCTLLPMSIYFTRLCGLIRQDYLFKMKL